MRKLVAYVGGRAHIGLTLRKHKELQLDTRTHSYNQSYYNYLNGNGADGNIQLADSQPGDHTHINIRGHMHDILMVCIASCARDACGARFEPGQAAPV
jgi:hypothetical protein